MLDRPAAVVRELRRRTSPATLESYDPAAVARMRRVNVPPPASGATRRSIISPRGTRGQGRVIAFQADVADADAVARMVTRTDAELGPVSILVNNAGIGSPGQTAHTGGARPEQKAAISVTAREVIGAWVGYDLRGGPRLALKN